jgi:hypothetical protein
MKSVRVVEGKSQFVSEDIERPFLPDGAVRVRIEASFLPPFFQHLPGEGWQTPRFSFTPGQNASGIAEALVNITRYYGRAAEVSLLE